MATFDLIRTGSLVQLDTAITISTNTTVTALVVTLTLPAGLAYNSGAATLGTIDDANPLLPHLDIATLQPSDTAQWVPIFEVTDEAAFSASNRTVTATVNTVPGEVETGNNIGEFIIGGTSCADIADCFPDALLPNGILSGGVFWQQDLDFSSSTIVYNLNGNTLIAAPQDITLDAADATNPRIDVIAVDENGDLVKITGTPAADPSKPDINEATQVEVTFVTVAALATVPSGFTQTDIYREDAGHPTEWNASESTAGARIDLASTAAFYGGTVGIETTDLADGDTMTFIAPAALNTSNIDQIVFRFRSLGFWDTGTLEFRFLNGTTPVSNTVVLAHGSYLNTYSTTDYILLGFDYSDFQFSGLEADRLVITSTGPDKSFYVDDIIYIEGYNAPGGAYADTFYNADGVIQDRNVTINGGQLIFDGLLNPDSKVSFTQLERLEINANSGNGTSAFFDVDQDAGVNLRFTDVNGDRHSFEGDATNTTILHETNTGQDVSINMFDSDGGKIRIEAATYVLGDNAGGNLPADAASSTHVPVLDTSTGELGKVEILDKQLFGVGSSAIAVSPSIRIAVLKTAITGGGDTLTLPSGLKDGQIVTVKDVSGNAFTNNITIDTAGAELIDGVASVTITTDYGYITVMYDGANFYIISAQ